MKAELVLGNLKREREALNGKLERLEAALGKEWQDEDQEYLCTQQYNAMCLYAHILDERIADIEIKLEEKKLASKDKSSHETLHTDEQLFNKDADFGDNVKDIDNTCSDEHCDCDIDFAEIIKMLLEDTFDVEVYWL